MAVGSHDSILYIYEHKDEKYILNSRCKGHNSAITCIDWSLDETYIRTVCNAYELLFWKISDFE